MLEELGTAGCEITDNEEVIEMRERCERIGNYVDGCRIGERADMMSCGSSSSLLTALPSFDGLRCF
jgi:hypothetical protein